MYDPALEYRKFCQKLRTEEQKRQKLAELAIKTRIRRKSNEDLPALMNEILRSYMRGDDILSPEFFEKQDIIDFARENHISSDPQVIMFINNAI